MKALKEIAAEIIAEHGNTLPAPALSAVRGMLWLDNINESFNGFISGHDEVMTFLNNTDFPNNGHLIGFRKQLRSLLPVREQRGIRI